MKLKHYIIKHELNRLMRLNKSHTMIINASSTMSTVCVYEFCTYHIYIYICIHTSEKEKRIQQNRVHGL